MDIHSPVTQQARQLAASCFAALDRPDLARLVLDGDGDDFAETKMAMAMLQSVSGQLVRYEHALRQYADESFWDTSASGGALALHDGGEMARNVLAGKPAFYHRD